MPSLNNGKLIRYYDAIYEYRLQSDGQLILYTPSLEIREYQSNMHTFCMGYLTYANDSSRDTRYNLDFFDIKRCPRTFYFEDPDDRNNRDKIAKELYRRADLLRQKATDTIKKAEWFTSAASSITSN